MPVETKPGGRQTVIAVEQVIKTHNAKSKTSGESDQVQIDPKLLTVLTQKLRKENKRKDKCLERISILLLVLFFLGLTVAAEHLNASHADSTTTASSENNTTPLNHGSTTPPELLNALQGDNRARRIPDLRDFNG